MVLCLFDDVCNLFLFAIFTKSRRKIKIKQSYYLSWLYLNINMAVITKLTC